MQSDGFSIAILVQIQRDKNSKGKVVELPCEQLMLSRRNCPETPRRSSGGLPDNFRQDNIDGSHGIMKNLPKAETISILSVALSYERTTLEVTKFD